MLSCFAGQLGKMFFFLFVCSNDLFQFTLFYLPVRFLY